MEGCSGRYAIRPEFTACSFVERLNEPAATAVSIVVRGLDATTEGHPQVMLGGWGVSVALLRREVLLGVVSPGDQLQLGDSSAERLFRCFSSKP